MLQVLPVRFTSVTTQENNCRINIQWQYELINATVSKFEVQRSTDAINYTVVGSTTGQSFTDAPPVAGIWYYRIKSIGNNGEVYYSDVVKAKTSCSVLPNTFNVYPNPVISKSSLYISYIADKINSNAFVKCIDALGRVQFLRTIVLKQGDNNIKVQLPVMPAGTYSLQLFDGEKKTATVQFVVSAGQ